MDTKSSEDPQVRKTLLDCKNIIALREGSPIPCNSVALLRDIRLAAKMIVVKHQYAYHLIDDVVSEAVIFLYSHRSRIPDTEARANSYVLSLCKGVFRRLMYPSREPSGPSLDDPDCKLQIPAAVLKEVGDMKEFEGIVNKVFRSYCFHDVLKRELELTEVTVPLMLTRPTYRRVLINAFNRMRYDRVDNVEETYKARTTS